MPRMTFMMVILLLLLGCTQQSNEQPGSVMLRLQLLLTQAATLSALPGESARQHALELARRAMSGSEMNAMHHGGGANNPMMKATHNLGDAVFEWLDVSPTTTANASNSQRIQIQIAAQAARMRLSGQLLGGDTGIFMQQKGQSLQASLSAKEREHDKAASHLFDVLNQIARTK